MVAIYLFYHFLESYFIAPRGYDNHLSLSKLERPTRRYTVEVAKISQPGMRNTARERNSRPG